MLWLAHQQLKSKSTRMRRQAVERLRRGMASAVIPVFTRVLREDPEAEVREAAALALSEHREQESVDALIAALTDPAAEVRSAAVDGLRRVGDSSAVPALAPLLKAADPGLRSRVAQALKMLGWQPDEPELEADFLVALGDLSRAAILGKAAVGALAKVLEDSAYQRRVVAVNRLAEIGDPTAIPPLIMALRDHESVVRSAAANALGRLGATVAGPRLVSLLRDVDPNVRAASAEALGLLREERAHANLVRLLQDKHWEARAAALEALGRLGNPEALVPICEVLQDRDREVREQAALALGHLRDPGAAAPLVLAMLDPERVVRHAASRVLQQLDPYWERLPAVQQALDEVRRALEHPDYGVRQVAGEILRRCGERTTMGPDASMAVAWRRRKTVDELLLDLLADPDPAMRQAGLECLDRRGDWVSAADRLSVLRQDVDNSVRRLAVAIAERLSPGGQTP
jgi:HEAT repeat protein